MRKTVFLLLPFWAVALSACQPDSNLPAAEPEAAATVSASFEKPAPTVVTTDTATPRPAPERPIEAERIKAEMLVFHGLPSEQITVTQLIRQLGRPDSVARGAVECGGVLSGDVPSPGDVWYYGRTEYEVAGKQAGLSVMDVRNTRFSAKLGPLLLNQKTTLRDVARFFPKAAQNVEPATISPALQQVSFGFLLPNGQMADELLELIFEREKLVSVNFWSPC